MFQPSMKTTRTVWTALAAAVLLSAVALSSATAGDTGPTRGNIPSEAFAEDGSIKEALVPDFITALDRGGEVVGYVSAADLGISGKTTLEDIPVYGDDLATQVGTMIAGRGFVPIGQSIDAVDPYVVETSSD